MHAKTPLGRRGDNPMASADVPYPLSYSRHRPWPNRSGPKQRPRTLARANYPLNSTERGGLSTERTLQITEYFPEEKEEEDATFIVSSFSILLFHRIATFSILLFHRIATIVNVGDRSQQGHNTNNRRGVSAKLHRLCNTVRHFPTRFSPSQRSTATALSLRK